MIAGRRILAVVPARAGSKGIPAKNMRTLRGLSLIGWAGRVLKHLPYLDARIISTDSAEFAEEGMRHGLDAPFLRPAELSGDSATAVDTLTHALQASERLLESPFDIVLAIEPTSPLRVPEDISRTLTRVLQDDCDSAVAVSRLDPKWHPHKALRVVQGSARHFTANGAGITARQDLEPLFWRNGVCYALRRDCLLQQRSIIGQRCAAVVIEHPVVNIDTEWELDWAEFVLEREGTRFLQAALLENEAVSAGTRAPFCRLM
jgi:CMP-N-acetylneuraminic acid synthetase